MSRLARNDVPPPTGLFRRGDDWSATIGSTRKVLWVAHQSSPRRDRPVRDGTPPRCGFTLIEMVAAMTMLVFVLSAVAMTISSLHRLNSKLRDEYPATAALVSLELRLRTDVHAAKQAAVETGEKLRLVLADDQTIEYSAKESRVYRYVKTGEKVVRPEIFAIPRGCEVGWSISSAESSLVTTTIQWHAGKLPGANDDRRVAKIISTVGWDHANR